MPVGPSTSEALGVKPSWGLSETLFLTAVAVGDAGGGVQAEAEVFFKCQGSPCTVLAAATAEEEDGRNTARPEDIVGIPKLNVAERARVEEFSPPPHARSF